MSAQYDLTVKQLLIYPRVLESIFCLSSVDTLLGETIAKNGGVEQTIYAYGVNKGFGIIK